MLAWRGPFWSIWLCWQYQGSHETRSWVFDDQVAHKFQQLQKIKPWKSFSWTLHRQSPHSFPFTYNLEHCIDNPPPSFPLTYNLLSLTPSPLMHIGHHVSSLKWLYRLRQARKWARSQAIQGEAFCWTRLRVCLACLTSQVLQSYCLQASWLKDTHSLWISQGNDPLHL